MSDRKPPKCDVCGRDMYRTFKDDFEWAFWWECDHGAKPHCQNCHQPMNQLPDDQIGEGWEYWHCELCHGGEPFKAGHYDHTT